MKTCYIFSAAEGLPKNFKRESGDIVIAADAGFKHLQKLNIAPDIVLGDFDSLGFVPENAEIIKHPIKKDDTDTLLAVKTGFSRGYTRFVLYGCTGGRLDHTLANLQTLNYIACKGGRGFICGNGFCATVLKNGELHFSSRANGNISVFAVGTKAKGVSLKGLLYNLNNAEIEYDFPLGVSNEFIGKEAVVSVTDGMLTVIWSGTLKDAKIDLV